MAETKEYKEYYSKYQSYRLIDNGPKIKKQNIDKLLSLLNIFFDKLNAAKNLLDRPYALYGKKQMDAITRHLESFTMLRTFIAKKTNNYNISNAWVKFYEIIVKHDLFGWQAAGVKIGAVKSKMKLFDNAAFPGSFVLAAHHYTQVRGIPFEWVASSLYDEKDRNVLQDSYKLYANYPSNWLMGPSTDSKTGKKILNNGDVLDYKNSKLLADVEADICSSDIGIGVPNGDYNNQEHYQAMLHLGQVLAAMYALKDGGSMVMKQYTSYRQQNISLIISMCQVFDEVYIDKPLASKPDNSETYLIGKGFRKKTAFVQKFIKAASMRLEEYKESNNLESANKLKSTNNMENQNDIENQNDTEKLNKQMELTNTPLNCMPLDNISSLAFNNLVAIQSYFAKSQICKLKSNMQIISEIEKNIQTSEKSHNGSKNKLLNIDNMGEIKYLIRGNNQNDGLIGKQLKMDKQKFLKSLKDRKEYLIKIKNNNLLKMRDLYRQKSLN